jgi:hypothetical protein
VRSEQEFGMESLWAWLGTPPGKDDVLDLFGVVCLLLFVPGFVISAFMAGTGADRVAKDPVQLAGIRYCASIGLWVFGAGLFFFGARVLQINPLSFGEPKWLLGSVVVVIFAAARCIDWWRTEYHRAPANTVYPLADVGSRISGAPARQATPETTVRR